MKFLQTILGGKSTQRKQLERFVEMEYAQSEREAALDRLLREAGL